MTIAEFYENINGDYNAVMERMLNKEELIHRFLKKFLTDPTFSRLEETMATNDAKLIFSEAHALKGVVSNLGLKPLCDTVILLVETTRSGETDGTDEMFELLRLTYIETVALIEKID